MGGVAPTRYSLFGDLSVAAPRAHGPKRAPGQVGSNDLGGNPGSDSWLIRTLRAREHVENDGNVFARWRGDRERLEELVVPEDLRSRVRAARGA
jgi:hypothetical protein